MQGFQFVFLTGAKVVILNRKILKFEIDLDFVLIAITTSLKDYRICYLINKYLNFNFIKSADLEVDILPGCRAGLFFIVSISLGSQRNRFLFYSQ